MALKKKTAPKPKVLCTLPEDERLEYARRYNLAQNKMLEFQAASSYTDQFQKFLVDSYDLPQQFDVNLQTGVITERMPDNAENGSV